MNKFNAVCIRYIQSCIQCAYSHVDKDVYVHTLSDVRILNLMIKLYLKIQYIDRQTGRQTDRQTDRHVEIACKTELSDTHRTCDCNTEPVTFMNKSNEEDRFTKLSLIE